MSYSRIDRLQQTAPIYYCDINDIQKNTFVSCYNYWGHVHLKKGIRCTGENLSEGVSPL